MMKKYMLIGAVALVLGACGGNANKDMTDTAQQNNPEALLVQAQEAYESGDKAAAIEAWKMAAEAGNAAAQHNLSVVYRTGDGAAQDEQMALDFLVKSAEQGYVPAVYDMGSFYLQQGDATQAAPLFQAAAEQGYAPAQFNLGVMLVRGDGVEQNKDVGIALIQQAAQQGFAPAQQALQQAQ
ncbi:sel1 repeat family protein [Cardiobacteriaceae bacterium TAE3-ERU3]|nr:sel1 repeat family protein [Cardiobacteriaceae bacterium TAE3-ERU3]